MQTPEQICVLGEVNWWGQQRQLRRHDRAHSFFALDHVRVTQIPWYTHSQKQARDHVDIIGQCFFLFKGLMSASKDFSGGRFKLGLSMRPI